MLCCISTFNNEDQSQDSQWFRSEMAPSQFYVNALPIDEVVQIKYILLNNDMFVIDDTIPINIDGLSPSTTAPRATGLKMTTRKCVSGEYWDMFNVEFKSGNTVKILMTRHDIKDLRID